MCGVPREGSQSPSASAQTQSEPEPEPATRRQIRSRSHVRREPSPPPESPPRIETEQKEDESDKVEDAVMVNPFSEALGDDYIETTKNHKDSKNTAAVNGPHKEDCHSEHKNYKVGKPQWSATSAEGQGDDAWRTEDTGVPVYPVVPSSQPAETIFFEPEPAPPSEASTEAPQCSIPALTNQNSTPAELIAFPGSRNLLRQAFRLRNLPEGSLDITIASLAANYHEIKLRIKRAYL
ncbi:hypothetical protein MSG28_007460 [Choristoneura fumiferana]|uniref:Uncharacterized protein n=1 Tax=Choristoneura fumiferana TaxID=7141 RepID=A0ACC0JX34_CHOFU|nr:hypothetical protein MSG28_007460 [Choristoneura fumiferana]